MKIKIRVKPNSKRESIEKLMDGSLRISVNAPAQKGKANQRLIEILSDYFSKPKSKIKIIHGEHSNIKLVEI